MKIHRKFSPAFTIVELIVVIVVLGILAGIVIVGFGSWQTSVAKKAVQSDLQMLAAAMEDAKNFGSGYPTDIPATFRGNSDVSISYGKGSTNAYCIQATSNKNSSIVFYIASTTKIPTLGDCTNVDLTVADTGGSASTTISYSDDFTGSGALGNLKTGSPTLAWSFLNSTSANWSRNSAGFATTTVTASSNPIAIADFGVANVAITEGVKSTGNAIYFRVVDGTNWLRAKVEMTSNTTTSSWYTDYFEYQVRNEPTWYNSGNPPVASTPAQAVQNCNDYAQANTANGNFTATRGCGDAVYNTSSSTTNAYYLVLDKSISGTVTQLASKSLGANMPDYIKVVANGSTITTSYGSTSAATSAGSNVTDSTNGSATKHGIGYASSSSGSSTGVKSMAIINAP